MDNRTTDCVADGDDNLYGLGVRLGIYLQWCCLLLAYQYNSRKLVGFSEPKKLLEEATLMLRY
jgi:hypothetical protein